MLRKDISGDEKSHETIAPKKKLWWGELISCETLLKPRQYRANFDQKRDLNMFGIYI